MVASVTAAQARRIVTLDDALTAIKAFPKAMKDRNPERGYTSVGLYIAVEDSCESGGSPRVDLSLDLDTAALLLPKIETLIREQLHALGARP